MSKLQDIEVAAIDGQVHKFGEYLEKATLVVNVASKCGFTPQYEALEQLYRKFKPFGFTVLGFPCDQFGHQEPGSESEILQFCSAKYDVTFPMFAKIEVNGSKAHPLYEHLKRARSGLLGSKAIKWNFTKFLVDGRGEVVGRYAPISAPASLQAKIEAVLK